MRTTAWYPLRALGCSITATVPRPSSTRTSTLPRPRGTALFTRARYGWLASTPCVLRSFPRSTMYSSRSTVPANENSGWSAAAVALVTATRPVTKGSDRTIERSSVMVPPALACVAPAQVGGFSLQRECIDSANTERVAHWLHTSAVSSVVITLYTTRFAFGIPTQTLIMSRDVDNAMSDQQDGFSNEPTTHCR